MHKSALRTKEEVMDMDVTTFAKKAMEDEEYVKAVGKSKARTKKIAKEFIENLLAVMAIGEKVELPFDIRSEYILEKKGETTFSLKPL